MKESAIKGNPLRLIGGVVAGIVFGILLFFGVAVLRINVQASHIGFIVFSLALITVSGYVSYRLADEPNKIKIKSAIIGILIGIIVFFTIFFFGGFLKTFLKIPYTDNNYNSQNIMFISQIISAIVSGYVSYRIGKSGIMSVAAAIFTAGISFLILVMTVF